MNLPWRIKTAICAKCRGPSVAYRCPRNDRNCNECIAGAFLRGGICYISFCEKCSSPELNFIRKLL